MWQPQLRACYRPGAGARPVHARARAPRRPGARHRRRRRRENTRLIVVGAGERGKLARRIIEGVADLVAERATLQVLIARPREPG
jgi:nucleotide-binding universal stress UspA family protein